MKENGRKILIVITSILLVVLVTVGIVMLFTQSDDKKDNKEKNSTTDNRCADNVCLSKVTLDENNGSKVLSLVMKNEGNTTVSNSCVKIIHEDKEIEYCFDELQAGQESTLITSAQEGFGEDIKEYKIEKFEKKAENNQNEPVTE